MSWFVYVARCSDDTLYCGITRDVAARIAEHDAGTGAKYTRGRGPLEVLIVRRCRTKPTALRLEYAVKQLTRRQKEGLVANPTGSWRHYGELRSRISDRSTGVRGAAQVSAQARQASRYASAHVEARHPRKLAGRPSR